MKAIFITSRNNAGLINKLSVGLLSLTNEEVENLGLVQLMRKVDRIKK